VVPLLSSAALSTVGLPRETRQRVLGVCSSGGGKEKKTREDERSRPEVMCGEGWEERLPPSSKPGHNGGALCQEAQVERLAVGVLPCVSERAREETVRHHGSETRSDCPR